MTVWLYLKYKNKIYIFIFKASQKTEAAFSLLTLRSSFDYFSQSQSFINIFRQVFKVYVFACNLSVQFKDVFCLVFKVGSGIEGVRYEEAVIWLSAGDVSLWNSDEFLLDGAKEFKSWLKLLVRIVCFDGCADNRNVVSLLANWVDCWDHHDVDI
jgi:hypothetical protein